MRKYNILTYALVVVLSLFIVVLAVQASSTIGTNLSTTGTLSVSGLATFTVGASSTTNFEAVGYASIGGNTTLAGTLGVTGVTTLSSRLSGTAASLSTNFEAVGYASVGGAFTVAGNSTLAGTLGVTGVTTLSSRLSGTAASLSSNFEAVGYASISGALQFGGSGTHTLGVNSGSGALTINAFTLGGAITGGSQNITGLGALGATTASLSSNFEAAGYASASLLNIGGPVASTSAGGARYTAEFKNPSTTVSTSINFGGNATKGTCLQMKDQLGNNVYVRIGTGATASASNSGGSAHFLISTTSCR